LSPDSREVAKTFAAPPAGVPRSRDYGKPEFREDIAAMLDDVTEC
jgi:hypothetical protein